MKKKILIAVCLVVVASLTAGVVFYFSSVLPARQKRQAHEQAVEAYRANKMAVYRQENERYADYEVDVAFLGDSLTDGYDVEFYYPQFVVSNRGIGGDTTFDLEARLQVSVYDLKPKVAVMLIGANNFDTMLDNYEQILMGLQENLPDTEIVLLSLTNMSQEWGKNNQIAAYNNTRIKKLAEKYGFHFVDLYTPLMNVETGEICPEYTTDGGHLTAKGYEVLTQTITPVLEEILGKE